MSTSRKFSLGAILSVTHDRLVTPDIGDVYQVVNHLTGDNITTIGLLAAHEPCKAALLAQHPQLRGVPDTCTSENWREWMAEQVATFGAELPVVPLEHWEKRSVADDILDVIRINPHAEIIAVEP